MFPHQKDQDKMGVGSLCFHSRRTKDRHLRERKVRARQFLGSQVEFKF